MLEFYIGTKKQDVQFGGLKGFQTDEKLQPSEKREADGCYKKA
jgi:hypothetical protein